MCQMWRYKNNALRLKRLLIIDAHIDAVNPDQCLAALSAADSGVGESGVTLEASIIGNQDLTDFRQYPLFEYLCRLA